MIQKLPIEEFNLINLRLADNYGKTEDKPNFRLVWADDERELRATNFTPEGLQLLHTEVREMAKYPDIKERYVLESLVENFNFDKIEDGKPVSVLVYQAIWTWEVFNDRRERIYIAPSYGACKFVVETVLNAVANAGNYSNKYKDPDADPREAAENKEQRLKGLEEELFGNESLITDSLSLRKGVAYGQGSSPNSSKPSIKGLE